jgi:hypothetical protein
VSVIGSIGTCKAGHVFRVDALVTYPMSPESPYIYCPECAPVMTSYAGLVYSKIKWHLIKGRNSKTVCDSACTSAKGEKCICACSGTNHGIDYGRF